MHFIKPYNLEVDSTLHDHARMCKRAWARTQPVVGNVERRMPGRNFLCTVVSVLLVTVESRNNTLGPRLIYTS